MSEQTDQTLEVEVTPPAPEPEETAQIDPEQQPDYVPDDPATPVDDEDDDQPDDPPEPDQPEDEDQLAEDLSANRQDIDSIATVFQKRGLDYEAMMNEYAANGGLSQQSYDALAKAGFPRSMVDAYCAGQEAIYERWVNHVQSYAGGAENYGELMRYAARAMTPKEKQLYDDAVNSGDPDRAKVAVQSLMYRYRQDNPADGYEYEGDTGDTAAPVTGFSTPEEAYAMEEDPRMLTDPAFKRLFEMRLMRTQFLKD